MIIKRATREDLPAVRELMQKYGKMTVDESLFNHRDIALQARAPNGACIGFTWVGLMAKGTIGYSDKSCIDPTYAGKGVGEALIKEALRECSRRGVTTLIGIVRQDKYHEASLKNGLKIAMGADIVPYTYVYGNVPHSMSELKKLGMI